MAHPRAATRVRFCKMAPTSCWIVAVALLSLLACFTEAQNPQNPNNEVQSVAAAGAAHAEVQGVQLLTATAVVTAPLTVRGVGAAVLDCGGLPTAFSVRWVFMQQGRVLRMKLPSLPI